MDKYDLIDMEKTGKNLKHLFEGMSSLQVAEEFGVSVGTVSYWTSGKKMPRLSRMVLIAKHFGCKIDDIVVVKEE